MQKRSNFIKWSIFIVLALFVCGLFVYFLLPNIKNQVDYNSEDQSLKSDQSTADSKLMEPLKEVVPIEDLAVSDNATSVVSDIPVTHIDTPAELKSVYISSWVAGSAKFRDKVIKLIDDTELNAIVIDVKDSTGRVSFEMADPNLQKFGSIEKRIANVRELTDMLHKKHIYIIGRVAVFQDPYMTNKMPSWAVTKKSDGSVWKDHKGLSFLDPAKKEVADYVSMVAKDAYDEGFDEINFDYIRYPSDGDMKDINYHLKDGETRADNIEKFFKNLSTSMKADKNIPISADLFGLTTEATDDMGIGQVWEKALPYFDYLCPMVYPSHYPPGQMGFKNPSLHPYEIINKALQGAINKTYKVGADKNKIRPWLQDFDLGTVYTKELIQLEMKAVYDNGLKSWMLWDPANTYTPSALKLQATQ